jgi:cadmium resistance transport/sequestration family protein
MLQTFFTSIFAFIATNVDDLFIIMMLLTQSSRRFKKYHIFGGQFLGMFTLIAISLVGLVAGLFIPVPYIGLLGLFPIYLGIKEIMEKDDDDDEIEEVSKAPKNNSSLFSTATLSVASITIANGGDNIGVYVPLFIAQNSVQLVIMILTFLALTWVWLIIANYLAQHPIVAKNLKKYNHILFPAMLILLGVYILYECKTYRLILGN